MKAKDLIKVLQSVDPESEVTMTLGRSEEYRDACAKAELVCGECLGSLSIDKVEVHSGKGSTEVLADIVLEQYNLPYLEDEAGKFDMMYTQTGLI